MRIAIIGGGPAGMTAAYKLSEALGKQVTTLDVYEKSDQVGGLSKSIELWGQRVDMGPHRFFSHDTRINKLWLEVVNNEYDIVNRQTRIYYKKKFFDYPIKAFNALSGLGLIEAARCVLSYGKEYFIRRDTSSFDSWVTSRFGKRLYTIFFKTYTEKLWGIPCRDLDSDFAAQRIKKLSLLEAMKNAIFPPRSARHATLVDQFAYPLKGTGSVYENMQEKIRERGGKVFLNSGVERVITKEGKLCFLKLEDGSEKEYDHVVSTMPLSLLVERLPEVPADVFESSLKLSYRNTILVYLRIKRNDLFSDQWLYVHEPSVKVGRVTNFRNWLPSVYGNSDDSILCLEYWCNKEDEIWKESHEALIARGGKEIVQTGLVKKGDVLDGEVVRLPRCYPVYFSSYRDAVKPLENYIDTLSGLHAIGRYGAYKYNNQDHSILMGIQVSENILEDAGHNLWEINTDYESYQEASVITKTGLRPRET